MIGVDEMILTPGMRQYMEVKQQYSDCIVLFRMGDFYETFFDDAQEISSLLGITLTARGKGESRAPLAGIPYHSLDRYLGKLMQAGKKVAICEQTEDPKKAKGLVKRDVVRILTPGTVVEDSILQEKVQNFIASIFSDGKTFGLSFVDVSTGMFLWTEAKSIALIQQELIRKKTAEVLVPKIFSDLDSFCVQNNIYINHLPSDHFFLPTAQSNIKKQFSDLASLTNHEFALCACGGLLRYLHDTQKQGLAYLKNPQQYSISEYMQLDGSTVRNLEILRNIRDGSSKGTLVSVLDQTKNPMGARMLKFWLTHPLKNISEIQLRLFAVKELTQDIISIDDIQTIFSKIIDIERLVSKISFRLTNYKDLVQLKFSLLQVKELQNMMSEKNATRIQKLCAFPDVSAVISHIDRAIADESQGTEIIRSGQGYSSGGSGRRDIGIIKKGFNAEIDSLYELKFDTTKGIKDIERTEQERTGMSLKIGYNSVFGYYIEITNKYKDQVPSHYIRKQTLVNAERFITPELKEFEEKLLHAEEKIVSLENAILDEVVATIVAHTEQLQKISEHVAELDVLTSFAKVALQQNYCLPEVSNSFELKLIDSRHPVIEVLEQKFIPNDCTLNEGGYLMLITGPNMAGKSTFMRQIALTILMAQCGSFVPATSAKISVVDQIFSRVGAYDDLTMGQSTFMVEMKETAYILNTATKNSFIILDEIGRGTSTFDGVAIAWSVGEYILKKIGAKTLFATHYHVLTKLEEHSGVVNYNVAVAEEDDKIIFLHKIHPGGTDKSYGIHVAQLAGIPNEAITTAKKVQRKLEEENKFSDKIVVESEKELLKIVTQKRMDEFK